MLELNTKDGGKRSGHGIVAKQKNHVSVFVSEGYSIRNSRNINFCSIVFQLELRILSS